MKNISNEELSALVESSLEGDQKSLETLVLSVQDLIFNLSLRMLGSFADAEDATQDIIIKIITGLSSFRKESAFSTWVYSIALNHLKNYKKHMFAQAKLSFELYGDDIRHADIHDLPDLTQDVEKAVLAEELKLSCTNVMLQCLDPESRSVLILGAMLHADSRTAAEILGMTPESYRQKLSRTRKKMAGFLKEYCGAYGDGSCKCAERVNYAIQTHRISPNRLDYTTAAPIPRETLTAVKEAMEEIDDRSQEFVFLKAYRSPERLKDFLEELLRGQAFSTVQKEGRQQK